MQAETRQRALRVAGARAAIMRAQMEYDRIMRENRLREQLRLQQRGQDDQPYLRRLLCIRMRTAGPNDDRLDVAERGHAALERVDELMVRLLPQLPPDWHLVLQGRIQRVQQAAELVAEGLHNLNQDDDAVSEDTKVSYWTAADYGGEVTSNE